MNNRISKVDNMNIISMDGTSVVEVGDSTYVTPTVRVIAVQREKAIFWEGEFPYRSYLLFHVGIPQLSPEENLRMFRINESCTINVNHIEILACAAASVVHIGSSELVDADARVKDIRHLLREPQE